MSGMYDPKLVPEAPDREGKYCVASVREMVEKTTYVALIGRSHPYCLVSKVDGRELLRSKTYDLGTRTYFDMADVDTILALENL